MLPLIPWGWGSTFLAIVTSSFKSNQNTFSIPCSIDYFRFGPGIGWYRYQVIGNRPSLVFEFWAKQNFNNCVNCLKQNQTSSKLSLNFWRNCGNENTICDLELKKWKIHEQPSVHCNVLHWQTLLIWIWNSLYNFFPISSEICERGRRLIQALCLYCSLCTILKKNMQVGCHISVVLKDQLILKIVYEKNL